MSFKEQYPLFPFASTSPPPADIATIADKVSYKRLAQTSISATIAAIADDSAKCLDGFSNACSYVHAGNWNSIGQHSAMRFTDVTIPADATILSAYITFIAQFSRAGQAINTKLIGELSQTPSQYGATEDFTARSLTATSASWATSLSWVAGNSYNSPDISVIIQELIDTYGAYGNGVVAIQWQDVATAPSYAIEFGYSYDADPTKVPVLHIVYKTLTDLSNQYLFQYQHRPDVDLGYLYVALLAGNNPEGLFSINDYATRGIEFMRVGAVKIEVYYDSVLKTTFPIASLSNTLYNGYYVLLPIP